jgi:hypothetical protein
MCNSEPEHVVFQVFSDYVNIRPTHFGFALQSDELTTSWDEPQNGPATVSPTFHTHGREITKFQNVSSQKSQATQFVIDFRA